MFSSNTKWKQVQRNPTKHYQPMKAQNCKEPACIFHNNSLYYMSKWALRGKWKEGRRERTAVCLLSYLCNWGEKLREWREASYQLNASQTRAQNLQLRKPVDWRQHSLFLRYFEHSEEERTLLNKQLQCKLQSRRAWSQTFSKLNYDYYFLGLESSTRQVSLSYCFSFKFFLCKYVRFLTHGFAGITKPTRLCNDRWFLFLACKTWKVTTNW